MGGLVKARRIFFRKPLDCFQALYVMRVFFSMQEIFSQGISLQVIFSPIESSLRDNHPYPLPLPSKVKWYVCWV